MRRHLRAGPNDPDGLDSDSDGIACERLPAPFDRTPVLAASGGAAGGAGGTLARTGTHTTPVLSLAGVLLGGGAALIRFSRYRPRHAR